MSRGVAYGARASLAVTALFTLSAIGTIGAPDALGTTTGSPDDDLLSGLITEEVEPGVLRIIADGHRELSPPTEDYVFDGLGKGWGALARSHEYRNIVAANDGSVWVFEPDRFFRIGKKREWDWRGQPDFSYDDDFALTPDGTVWRVAGRGPDRARSFGGRQWTRHEAPRVVRSVETEPDGTVWTTWWRPFGADSIVPDRLARWDGRRWKAVDLPEAHGSLGNQFAVSGKDEVWFCCKPDSWRRPQDLLRYRRGRWTTIADPAPQDRPPRVPILIDGVDDGRLWMRRSPTLLARHDDRGWTVFESGEGDPSMDWMVQETGGFLRGSPDGSAWVTVAAGNDDGDCDGLARFDGEAWTRYLPERCIFAIDIAPGGTAWVQAARMDVDEDGIWLPLEPVQTYAVRPARDGEIVNPGGRIPTIEETQPAIAAMTSRGGFGGAYFVPSRVYLPVFLVTDDRAPHIEEIEQTLGADATFEVRVVERSMGDLLAVKDAIVESTNELHDQGITLVSVGLDVTRNRVEVGVLDRVKRAREALSAYGDAVRVVKETVSQFDCGAIPPGAASQ